MQVKGLLEELKKFNPEADVNVLAMNRHQDFTLSWGGCEGCTKDNCDSVSLYVDALNQSEVT